MKEIEKYGVFKKNGSFNYEQLTKRIYNNLDAADQVVDFLYTEFQYEPHTIVILSLKDYR